MENKTSKFVGRHQLALEAGKLLGYEFSNGDIQQAVGKDISEHAELLRKTEQLEEDVKNGDLNPKLPPLAFFDVLERARKLLTEGYEKAILGFDRSLEDRIEKIYNLAEERICAVNESYREKTEKMKYSTISLGGIFYPSLGGLVATGNENLLEKPEMQKAWFSYALLTRADRLQISFLLADKEEMRKYGEQIRKISADMLAKQTISAEEFNIINENFETLSNMANEKLQGSNTVNF